MDQLTNSQREAIEKLRQEIRGYKKEASEKQGEKQGDYEVGNKKPPKECQFKPGQSGNPKGYKKGKKNFDTLFNEAIEEIMREYKKRGKDIGDAEKKMLVKAITEALKGDYKYFSYLMDRRYGKPKQSIEQTGESSGPIELDFRITNAINRAYGSKQSKN